jgi:5-methylcytosine-specific restriction endonuclease McrA
MSRWRTANPDIAGIYLIPDWSTPIERKKIRQAEWRRAHPKELNEYRKEYDRLNPKKKQEQNKRWRQANPDKTREQERIWHLAHPLDPVLKKANFDKYRADNPEKFASYSRTRRARKRGAETEPYTVADILDLYGSLCHLCGEEIDLSAPRRMGIPGWENGLQLDHVIPLSQGGTDLIGNVKPSHGKCNASKGDSLLRIEVAI